MKTSYFFKAIVVGIVLFLGSVNVWAQPVPVADGFQMPFDGNPSQTCDFGIFGACYHDDEYHLAEDYAMSVTTPIYACANGIVRRANSSAGYGGIALIEHRLPSGEHVVSLCAHMLATTLEVSLGEEVTRGQVIGYVAATGDNGGNYIPHVHFGMHKWSYNDTPTYTCNGGWAYQGYSIDECAVDDWYDPSDFITDHPVGSSQVGYFADGWHDDGISQAFLDKYNQLSSEGYNLGNPWDNGPYDQWVHEQNGMYIQDFFGHDNGCELPYTALIRKAGVGESVNLLKDAFWDLWINKHGWINFGAPTYDEYPIGGNVRQDFSDGTNYYYFFWDGYMAEARYASNGQPVDLVNLTAEDGNSSRSFGKVVLDDFPVFSELNEHVRFQEGLEYNSGEGSGIIRPIVRADRTESDGVYHSNVQVADFGQPFELVNQQGYSDFYAVINEAVIPIDNFFMDGDMTIYVGDPPPEADIQFSHWTIYPSPITVGEQLHVEGEIYNAGGSSVTASELRIELLDPNGSEVFHYSSYNVVIDPGWGWYLWIELYPYMPGNHTARYRGLIDGQWQTYAIETVYVQPQIPVSSFSLTPSSGDVSLYVQFTDQSSNNPNDWWWDFGDEHTSTSQHPSHIYNTVGTYSVSLTATNSAGSDVEICSNCITVNQVVFQPVADFSVDLTSGESPLTVQFTDLSANEPTTWWWDFGDEHTSTSQHPNHVYNTAGTYSVSLTATNSAGSDIVNCNNCIIVTFPILPPIADFSYDPSSGDAPLTVQFTNLSTNNPTSYWWDFGDGYTSTSQHPSHVYDSIGTHTVYLSVANDADSDIKTCHDCITVNQVIFPVVANFVANDTSGFVPLRVYFYDQSSNNPDHWYWDFGDGDTSTVQHPNHIYDAIGDYNVSLTTGNSVGSDSIMRIGYIHVGSAAIDLEITYLDGSIVLDWNDVLGAEWYYVYYANDNDKYAIIDKTGLSTCTLSMDFFDSASTWFFYVTALQ